MVCGRIAQRSHPHAGPPTNQKNWIKPARHRREVAEAAINHVGGDARIVGVYYQYGFEAEAVSEADDRLVRIRPDSRTLPIAHPNDFVRLADSSKKI